MKGWVHMNASEFGLLEVGEFVKTWVRAGGKRADITDLTQDVTKCVRVIQFLRGEADIVLRAKPVPGPEVVIDPVIRVDRSVRPSYPRWVTTAVHPNLENAGPPEYDITKTEQWLHDCQKDGKCMSGDKIYVHLKETSDLKNHGTLRDLEEIQKKGVAFFRKHFAGKAVFAWGSVVRHRDGLLNVPYLFEDGGEVVLPWRWLDNDWDSSCPGLRHAS